ncbi:Broad specificity phosphatase PhoE [Thermomonospora echinospora]|uniref:Broad specificity phosphatase PhoE n=1 Tax=Thermomonospora echinospora TaxID=1992 RepID=A0A1H6D4T3_9ACTN|nr:histidine phosphatase family protein [Thermomonospora echinospora]SEG80379.1 Broad specificity phosphatase PhoE [Thermomonospora echinospora]
MAGVRNLESLILTRHGESTGNLAHQAARDAPGDRIEEVDLCDRDADVPLSERGRLQAVALGRRLAALPPSERPTAVVSSPYVRSLDTARIALAELQDPPDLLVDERLRDREMGVLYRLTPHGVRVRYPEEAERSRRLGKFYYRPPGGESWADMLLRLRSAYLDIDLDHPGGRVLVVVHDAVVVLTRYIVEGLSERELMEIERTPIGNCSFTRWVRRDGVLRPAEYNDTAHLSEPAGAPAPTAAP